MKIETSPRIGLALYFRATLLASILLLRSAVADESLSLQALTKISFDQKPGQRISLDLPFRDEEGKTVRLGDCFGRKPAILVLGYYQCPMLCTIVLNGLVESLQDVKWSIGRELTVISVSISPSEGPSLAAAKKRTYLKRYGRAAAAQGWHFLTGDEAAIKKLADEVGFRYAYDPGIKQYAHPSGFIVLTPEGEVSRYFFGAAHSSKEVSAALKAASSNQISPPVQQLLLLCFHYNPITGKYSLRIMSLLRLLSVATVLALAGGIALLVKRGSQRDAPSTKAMQPEVEGASVPSVTRSRAAPEL
jgi:protein SCO1/2